MSTVDFFGMRNLYPTRIGGREWFIDQVPFENDPQLFIQGNGPSMIKTIDGYYIINNSAKKPRLFIKTKEYRAAPCTSSHSSAVARGWMSTAFDWGPSIEMSLIANLNNGLPHTEPLYLDGPTGEHPSNTFCCTGSAYGAVIDFYTNPVSVSFYKEQAHNLGNHYLPYKDVPSMGFQLRGHGDVGIKYIQFQNFGPTQDFVKLELWLNPNGDKVTFTKVNEVTDTTGWGTSIPLCGNEGNTILNFRNGRMRMYHNWDAFSDFKFKNLSVREITSNILQNPSEPPISNPAPQQGAFRRIYDIIYDMGVFEGDECGFPEETGEFREPYSVPQNAEDNDTLQKSRSRLSIFLNSPSSLLVGERPFTVFWRLKKHGNPTSAFPITCHIRRANDFAIVETFDYVGGTLTPDLLSGTTYDQYEFTNLSANYALQPGDMISIEWTGGESDGDDRIRVGENELGPYDGSATCERHFDVVDQSGKPVAYGSPRLDQDLAAIVRVKA